jgi:hypothetical protein
MYIALNGIKCRYNDLINKVTLKKDLVTYYALASSDIIHAQYCMF